MTGPSGTPGPTLTGIQDACAELTAEADRRLGAATDARAAAAAVVERLVAARGEMEARTRAAEQATAAAETDRLESMRSEARDQFRAASAAAHTPGEIAAAGVAWLKEVDRLADLAAAVSGASERARADALIATALVEHLTAEADAARHTADHAESAAVEARSRAETCLAEAAAREAAARAEAARIEAERAAAEAAAARAVAERVQAERAEAERVQAERAEAERVQAERAEAERVQAERAEAERAEAERAEAERVQAERAEAERVQAERAEAERAEAERAAKPKATSGAARKGESASRRETRTPRSRSRGDVSGEVGAHAAGAHAAATAADALGLSASTATPEAPQPRDDGGRLTPKSNLSRILAGEPDRLGDVADRTVPDSMDVESWREELAQLCEALLRRAIDAGALEVPATHEFWGAFTGEQARDILSALAALGFRADGLGGWQDDRVPSQREISIAVAHAGLDPMRIRHWPTQAEATDLVRDAQVLGGEYVAAVAPSLAARELRLILGKESARFDPLWDAWASVRPALLEAGLERSAARNG